MYCPHCGRLNEPGAAFCVRCGAALPQPVARSPQPGPAAQDEPARKRSPLLSVAVGCVAALLILCCCGVLIGGGGATLYVYLSPTYTPTATPTPTPTATPTRTPRPTGRIKTYSSARYGFSIQYPSDWRVQESNNGVTFASKVDLTEVTVGGISNFRGDEKALTDSLLSYFKDAQVVSEDTRTFNGLTWRYLAIVGTYSGASTKWDVYARVHTNGTAYLFVGVADVTDYDERTQTFTEMMESFKFLP